MSANATTPLLQTYLTLQAQIDELQAKRDKLKEQLLEQLPSEPVTHEGFTFSKAMRTTYTHTDAIKTQEIALKEAKKVEIDQGLATAKQVEFLTVRKAKRNG